MRAKRSWFTHFAKWTAHAAGRPAAFFVAVLVLVVWAIAGPIFGFSDSWQLAINSSTTIVTVLMVFLIQNTQSRDAEATQIKLFEIIRSLEGAHNSLLDLEELEDDELHAMRDRYRRLAAQAREAIRTGGRDTGSGDIDSDEPPAKGG